MFFGNLKTKILDKIVVVRKWYHDYVKTFFVVKEWTHMYAALVITAINVGLGVYGYYKYTEPPYKVTVINKIDYRLDDKPTKVVLYTRSDLDKVVLGQYENKFPSCKKGDTFILSNSFLSSFCAVIIGVMLNLLYYWSAFTYRQTIVVDDTVQQIQTTAPNTSAAPPIP